MYSRNEIFQHYSGDSNNGEIKKGHWEFQQRGLTIQEEGQRQMTQTSSFSCRAELRSTAKL